MLNLANIYTEVNESNKKLLKLYKSFLKVQKIFKDLTFKNKTLFKNSCRYNIEQKSTQSAHVDKRSHVCLCSNGVARKN